MKFKRPVIKQMLSEEIIIANSQLHDKTSSPILPVHHHTKALMRRPHTGFTFVGTRVNYFTGISEAHKQWNSHHTEETYHAQLAQSPFTNSLLPQIKHKLLPTADPYKLPYKPHKEEMEREYNRENQTHHQFPKGDSNYYRP